MKNGTDELFILITDIMSGHSVLDAKNIAYTTSIYKKGPQKPVL